MKRNTAIQPILYGLIAAIIGTGALVVIFSKLDISRLESIVFGILGGVLVGSFIYRDKSLILGLRDLECSSAAELEAHATRIENLYVRSMNCIARFVAHDFRIDRVSLGFLRMLSLDSSTRLVGRELDEVLQVDASDLKAFVEKAEKEMSVIDFEFSGTRSNGDKIRLLASGTYFEESQMVEACFFLLPAEKENQDKLEQSMIDLERFRRAVVRRETRILELKGEVNTLLEDTGEETRYRIDDSTEDAELERISLPKVERKSDGR